MLKMFKEWDKIKEDYSLEDFCNIIERNKPNKNNKLYKKWFPLYQDIVEELENEEERPKECEILIDEAIEFLKEQGDVKNGKYKFKEWNKFIENNKNNIFEFEIYYNLKINDNLIIDELSDEDIKRFISLISETYIKDEQGLRLEYICDKAVKNKEKILNNDWTKRELLEVCYE